MAIISVFYTREIGMSVQEIMWLQGSFGLAMLLLEFPSGYLADRIGYRRSLIIASFTQIVGWGIYAWATTFPQIVLAEMILGGGFALVSGSDQALLYESLLETDQEELYAKWSGRMKFWGQFGEGSAAVFAGSLYAYANRSPFMIEIVVWLVAIVVAFRIVEPNRHRPPSKDNWAQIKRMLGRVMVDNPALRTTFFTIILLGMSSFIPVWTIQLYALEGGLKESWLGPLWAVANYVVAFGAIISHRLSKSWGTKRVLLVCAALVVGGYLGLGLSYGLFGFMFYYALTLNRGLFNPILQHEEQRLITSADRAGFLSLRSLCFRGIFLMTAPFIGMLMDQNGQQAVFLGLTGVFAVLVLVGIAKLIKHEVIR